MVDVSSKEIINIVFPLLGGLGLFLYGMMVMSEGLKNSAGNQLEKIIELMSGNIFVGIFVGTVTTMIIQSSSATTVMVVGFVNAGIMNLSQAIGIIMGANIGTTITAQLVSFDLIALAPVAIAVGISIKLFSKKNKIIILGEIVLGFGILFLGMEMMKSAMSPLKTYSGFTDLIVNIGSGTVRGTLKGFFVGFVMTAIVQSSSATSGILIALAGTGVLPIESAFPILLGINVGTCVTALLSSISANRMAKRTAVMHLLIKIIGTVIFIIFFSRMTVNIVKAINDDAARQIANAHTFFNLLNTLILLPFSGLIIKMVQWIIPTNEVEIEEKLLGVKYLDNSSLEIPHIAMVQVIKEVLHLGHLASMSYHSAVFALMNNDENAVEKTFKIEKSIDALEDKISEYLIKLANQAVGDYDFKIIDGLFRTMNDIERVGDHAENLAELATFKIKYNITFSKQARDELEGMINLVEEAFSKSLEAMRLVDDKLAFTVLKIEADVDEMENELRSNLIERLNQGQCEPHSGIIFLNIISNLERISDHSENIAEAVLAVKI